MLRAGSQPLKTLVASTRGLDSLRVELAVDSQTRLARFVQDTRSTRSRLAARLARWPPTRSFRPTRSPTRSRFAMPWALDSQLSPRTSLKNALRPSLDSQPL